MKRKLLIEVVGLQTPRGRLIFFAVVTLGVVLAPFDWLSNLSLWQRLDIPSPSIGLTRSYKLLLSGDIVAAWERNRLIFVVIAVGGPIIVRDAWHVYRRRASTSATLER